MRHMGTQPHQIIYFLKQLHFICERGLVTRCDSDVGESAGTSFGSRHSSATTCKWLEEHERPIPVLSMICFAIPDIIATKQNSKPVGSCGWLRAVRVPFRLGSHRERRGFGYVSLSFRKLGYFVPWSIRQSLFGFCDEEHVFNKRRSLWYRSNIAGTN